MSIDISTFWLVLETLLNSLKNLWVALKPIWGDPLAMLIAGLMVMAGGRWLWYGVGVTLTVVGALMLLLRILGINVV